MRKLFRILVLLIVLVPSQTKGQGIELASEAVANMRLGWNLGNTLDSNSGDVKNMWIEAWSSRTPKDYETAWGQPQATRELIHMFKEAGFNAIRVPVTWYPHMGTLNNVSNKWDMEKWSGYTINTSWMKRVKEVVDYVIEEGMYCILNVHHDTGTSSTAWIKAEMTSYEKYAERYEKLWTAIANEFKDYDGHLLFEGYNEMTDKYDSWCFASFGSVSRYVEADAKDAYNAVNSYAQLFVDAVRATGGNNAKRNLIVNTYASCDGHGNWNPHLLDPLKQMKLPMDSSEGHLAFQVHSYWDTNNYNANMRSEINQCMADLKTYLANKHKVPLIIGEWGSSSSIDNSNTKQIQNRADFARFFVEKTKAQGFATFYWMGLSDETDRSVPQWTQPEVVEAMAKGYYGDQGYVDGIEMVALPHSANKTTPSYTLSGRRADRHGKGIVVKNGRLILNR